jgi:DNA-binding protein HU-beta
MNKAQFVKHIRSELPCNEDEAIHIIDSFTKCVTSALGKEDEVFLIGFGRFSVSKVAAREGRNPKTGEVLQLKAYNQPKFKVGQLLKDAVNNR